MTRLDDLSAAVVESLEWDKPNRHAPFPLYVDKKGGQHSAPSTNAECFYLMVEQKVELQLYGLPYCVRARCARDGVFFNVEEILPEKYTPAQYEESVKCAILRAIIRKVW